MIFMYFFLLIYIFSAFIFIFTFGGDARGGVTGKVEISDRGLTWILKRIWIMYRLDMISDICFHIVSINA